MYQYLNISIIHYLNILISQYSNGIFCQRISAAVIWFHLMSSAINICLQMSSVVFWCHLMSSDVIWCHPMSIKVLHELAVPCALFSILLSLYTYLYFSWFIGRKKITTYVLHGWRGMVWYHLPSDISCCYLI